ncbi:MAG: DUF4331 family protein [Flavobacteriales bacterium]|nr:DUF4331 family protein [Flavobacteriales bacterium]
MKNRKRNLALSFAGAFTIGLSLIWAADHIDAPSVASTTSDITDYYAFQSPENNDNMVFVANVQGLLDPASTASASFDELVLVEFNIDNSGDLVEDLVIQAIVDNGKVKVYGPTTPSMTGTTSILETTGFNVEADVTLYGSSPVIGNNNGIKVFAGPRDDPFFMDFAQYGQIIAGNASSFNNPGSDTFAGTNVMSIVIEVPKSTLGSATTINTWVESKREV